MIPMHDLIGKKVVDLKRINEGLPNEAFRIEFEDGIVLQFPFVEGIELLYINNK
jgi:hypothetical protein